MSSYVDQIDRHAPSLTVEETLIFAWHTLGAKHHVNLPDRVPGVDDTFNPRARDLKAGTIKPPKLDFVLNLLGIEHVRDTIVGNAVVRGVSGGQRRRVTIGEMFMGTARVLRGAGAGTPIRIVRPVLFPKVSGAEAAPARAGWATRSRRGWTRRPRLKLSGASG